MTKICHNRRLQTNQQYCEEETQNILGLDCILLYMKSKISNSFFLKIVSEYDQEIPQSQTADNPAAPRGRAAQPSQDTRKTN